MIRWLATLKFRTHCLPERKERHYAGCSTDILIHNKKIHENNVPNSPAAHLYIESMYAWTLVEKLRSPGCFVAILGIDLDLIGPLSRSMWRVLYIFIFACCAFSCNNINASCTKVPIFHHGPWLCGQITCLPKPLFELGTSTPNPPWRGW